MTNPLRSAAYDAHGTPRSIVFAAHAVMGGIDLDPASSALGNTRVQAGKYYDRDRNGLVQPWSGRVFLNPPGGVLKATANLSEVDRDLILATRDAIKGQPWYRRTQSIATIWIDRLFWAWRTGEIDQAILILFNSEVMGARPELYGLPRVQSAYTDRVRRHNAQNREEVINRLGRVCYLDSSGNPGVSPTHTSSFVYFPPADRKAFFTQEFARRFIDFGIYQPPSMAALGEVRDAA